MRHLLSVLCLASAVLLAACSSTPDSRIARSHAAFDQYPSAVQEKIRAGEVDIGFTPEMVVLALGEPSRQFTHQSATGTAEIWIYHDNGPRFSFGIGVGSFGRHSATSVGVSSSTGSYDPEERMRVEFRDGKVTAIEYAKR